MDDIAASLRPEDKAKLQQVADGMLKIYHTLVRMGYLGSGDIDEGPHDLRGLLPFYEELEIDPTIIYLYSILPYLSAALHRVDFYGAGETSDFRQKEDIRTGRNPMYAHEEESQMRPWMTALSQCGNHQKVLIYDASRHVIGIYGQMDCGSSDPRLWDDTQDGSNDGSDDCEEEDGDDESSRLQDGTDSGIDVEQDENVEEDSGDDEGDTLSDDENHWDEMDARPAGKVLRDIVRWYEDLSELPGQGERTVGGWDADLLKPLYIEHGWPGPEFDREAFQVARVQEHAMKKVRDDAEQPHRNLQEISDALEIHMEKMHGSQIAQDRSIAASAGDIEEKWLASWRICKAENMQAVLERRLLDAKEQVEKRLPKISKLQALQELHRGRELSYPVRKTVEDAGGVENLSAQDRYRYERELTQTKVYEKAYEKFEAEIDPSVEVRSGRAADGIDLDEHMRSSRHKLDCYEAEIEVIEQWLENAPAEAIKARQQASQQLQRMQSWRNVVKTSMDHAQRQLEAMEAEE